jgi:hypothetical protein
LGTAIASTIGGMLLSFICTSIVTVSSMGLTRYQTIASRSCRDMSSRSAVSEEQ